jgi:hypothetical protein
MCRLTDLHRRAINGEALRELGIRGTDEADRHLRASTIQVAGSIDLSLRGSNINSLSSIDSGVTVVNAMECARDTIGAG